MTKGMKGITLIALVITIIVLLILAGITIATVMGENGILAKTNEAKKESALETAEEIVKLEIENLNIENHSNDLLENKINISDEIDNIIDYTNNTKVQAKDGVIATRAGAYGIALQYNGKTERILYIDKDNFTVSSKEGNELKYANETVKIGDYVNYKCPDNLGYDGTWRVSGVEEGQVKLISTNFVSELTLNGREGYNQGLNLLEEICNKYSDGVMSTNSRSINMDDIVKLGKYDKTTYGTSKIYQYGNKVTYKLTADGVSYSGENGVSGISSDNKKFVSIEGKTLEQDEEYTITSNMYGDRYGIPSGSIEHTVLFKGYSAYWLANQYTLAGEGYVKWTLFHGSGYGTEQDTRYPLWNSKERANNITNGVRAVVYLKDYVQIDTSENKDGSTEELAYELL